MTDLSSIEVLLRGAIGLAADTLGPGAVADAVRQRATALGVSSERYAARVASDAAELQSLIEQVVVSESWFFREPAAFVLLAERARSLWSSSPVVRVLSIPCATGEEPYSAAITLLEAGVPPTRIEVSGVDVSERAISAAREARYSRNAFRGERREDGSYFEQNAGTTRVVEQVRALVQFRRGNILDATLLAGRKYHAVFCRNLLIYLDKPARRAALENLSRALRPEGVLFVGHSEAADVARQGWTRIGDPRTFAFAPERSEFERPTGTLEMPALPRDSAKGGRLSSATPQRAAPRGASLASLDVQTSSRGRPAESPVRSSLPREGVELLERARALADRGALEEALVASRAAVELTKSSADAHSLLGLVQRARGDLASAQRSWLRALELDPDHHQTLIHLSLLAEHLGDHSRARAYRDRAQTARKR